MEVSVMKRIAIVALLVCFAALPLMAGTECASKSAAMTAGDKKEGCTADTQICLNKMAAKLRAKGWVGIELENSDSGVLTVTRVEYDSPATRAGLQAGDILVALNGVAFSDEQVWDKNKDAMRVGNTITYTVERDGYKKEVNIELAQLPEEIMAKWVGRHMLEHASMEMAQMN